MRNHHNFQQGGFSPLLPQAVRPTNFYKGLKPLANHNTDHNADSRWNCGVNHA
jgi:hypothetical protein